MADLDSGLTDSELVNSVQRKAVADRVALKAYEGVFEGQRVVQSDIDLGYVWDSIAGVDNGGTIINVAGGSWRAEIYSPVFHLDWFDVKYSTSIVFTDETVKVQSCIDAAKDWSSETLGGHGSVDIFVAGWVRISATLVSCNNVLFIGASSTQSKIIWIGGNTTNHDIATSSDAVMIDFGHSPWGGFRGIKIQGFDQFQGEVPSDGIDHLTYYTFIDFMHAYENTFLACGVLSGMKMYETDGEEHFTNFNAMNIFANLPSSGYLFDFEIPSFGANRVFNLDGLTLTNDPEGNSLGVIRAPGSIDFILNGGRIESNHQSNHDDLAIVTYTSTVGNVASVVTLSGITGYDTGSGSFTVVKAPSFGEVAVTMTGCGLRGAALLKTDDTPSKNVLNTGDTTSSLLAGVKISSLALGAANIHSYNSTDTTVDNLLMVKKGDIALTNDGDGHLLHYLIDDDLIYAAGLTGYHQVAYLSGIVGQTTIDFDKAAGFKVLVNMRIRITGGGVAGDLDTTVTALDFLAGTITIADALGADITRANTYLIGSVTGKTWLYPVATLPVASPAANDEGASVYVKDLGAVAYWSSDKWMYGMNFADTTANRPLYSSNVRYTGCQMFDITLGIPIWWNGTVWVDATGTTV